MKRIFKSALAKLVGLDVVFKLQDGLSEPKSDAYILRAAEHYKVQARLMTELPQAQSGTVFLCTHHTGGVDILGLYPFLRQAVTDLKIVVNWQLMAISVLRPIFISVLPPSHRYDNRNAREQMIQHLKNGGNLLLYPAGKIAMKKKGAVVDLPWQMGSVPLIRSHAQRIIPIFVEAENRNWFYFLRRFFPRLSQVLILRALMDRPKEEARIYFGEPISPDDLKHLDHFAFMLTLREATYQLKFKNKYRQRSLCVLQSS